MKKITLLFVLFAFAKNYGQITFEKGYFITNKNERIECLIKNQDWLSNPNKIEYKISEASNLENIDFNEIKSFEIYNTNHHYQKHTVNIDKNLGKNFNPVTQSIVLQILIEGSATLYKHNNEIFFYSKGVEGEIKQLVYSEYVNLDNRVEQNNSYRLELYENLKCEKITANDIRKTEYKEKSLLSFFRKYNECTGESFTDFTKAAKKTKTIFHASILGGVNYNNKFSPEVAILVGTQFPQKAAFKGLPSQSLSPVVGFELEVLLPFNKNKWGLIFSPTYQSFKSESSKDYYNAMGGYYNVFVPSAGGVTGVYATHDFHLDAQYNYSYIELPIGVRHYFHLNENSIIAVDAVYGTVVFLNEEEKVNLTQLRDTTEDFALHLDEISTKRATSSIIKTGAHYLYKNRYSIGLNYYVSKKISNSNGSSISLIASYKFF